MRIVSSGTNPTPVLLVAVLAVIASVNQCTCNANEAYDAMIDALLASEPDTEGGPLEIVDQVPPASAEEMVEALLVSEAKSSPEPSLASPEPTVTDTEPTNRKKRGRGRLTPPPMGGVECIDRSLKVRRSGVRGLECIGRNEAICRGDWKFGITDANQEGTFQVSAWSDEGGSLDIVYAEYDDAEKLCVGTTARNNGDTSYLSIKTEEGTWYLVCPGVGNLRKDPKLKIRVRKNKDKKRKKKKRDGEFYDTIVKYRRGANKDDTLWAINTDGTEDQNAGCEWEFLESGAPVQLPASS